MQDAINDESPTINFQGILFIKSCSVYHELLNGLQVDHIRGKNYWPQLMASCSIPILILQKKVKIRKKSGHKGSFFRKVQKTFTLETIKDSLKKTSNRRSSQYVFCSSQTTPNLYVPKRTSYRRTFLPVCAIVFKVLKVSL